jgi:hypothetical protein
MTKQARILAFTDNEGRALYLKLDGAVIAMRDIAQDILRNFNAYPQEIPLFADHKWGQAYGWVKSISLQNDGIYATIELNEDGVRLIENNNYKYLSPGLQRDVKLPTGETLPGWSLVEVSLTNMPYQFGFATFTMSAIALAQPDWRANNDPFEFPIEAERAWDADATESEWRNWVSDKDPEEWGESEWRRYRQRFLAYDAANPNRFASYKLPVVALVDGKPHLFRRALIAAKATLAGARGGVDLPQSVQDQLTRKIQTALEEISMTRDELAQTLNELLAPLAQRIEQIENTLREQNEKRREDELAQTIAELSREIQSWRYNNDTEAIPPRIAESYALMLARIPEPARTELILTLKQHPPITMPITPSANHNIPTPNNPLTPLQEKYANLLGVSPETFLKYNNKEV